MFFNILAVLCTMMVWFGVYLLCRNERVHFFRITLNHITSGLILNFVKSFENDGEFTKHYSEYEYLDKCRDNLWNKHTYTDMLLSFKPLRLEKWYTDEEIRFMREYKEFLPSESELAESVDKVLNEK